MAAVYPAAGPPSYQRRVFAAGIETRRDNGATGRIAIPDRSHDNRPMSTFLICFAIVCYALAFALRRGEPPSRHIPGPGDEPGGPRKFSRWIY
jgi:hypothetical protein